MSNKAGTHRHLDEVAPGVWVATAELWATTSTLVVAEDGACLVVDPALTAAEVAALVAEVEGRGWRVTAGFSTHPHWDHLLGAATFPGVPHWATAGAAAWTRHRERALREEAERDAPGATIGPIGGVTALPAGAGRLAWDGPTLEIIPLPGHSPGHAGLLLRQRGVLLCGDMLSDREIPLLDTGARDSVAAYGASLATLAGLLTDADVRVVVPGHGRVADRAEALARLAADRRYLDDLAAGRPSADPRLADPWVRAEHEGQAGRIAGTATRVNPAET